MANSLTFNDIDLIAYGVTVLSPFLPYFSEAQAPLVNLALSDGGVSSLSRYAARVFVVPCIVKGAGFADLKSKLDSIASVLSQRDLQTLSFDMVSGRHWLAKVSGDVGVTSLGSSVARISIPFIIPDPHAHADTETVVDTGDIPGTIVCTPGGTIETHPIIFVKVNSTHPFFLIANDSLDERLEWTSPGVDLVSGDEFTLDCRPRYQTLSIKRVADAESTVQMEGVEGIFPQLSPGVGNDIIFYSISASEFSITWNDRYQ